MLICATFHWRHARDLMIQFVLTVSPTNSVNLLVSDGLENLEKPTNKACFSGDQELDNALLTWPHPRISPADLTLWEESQDRACPMTQHAFSDFLLEDLAPAPLSPTLHPKLIESKKIISPIASSPHPFDTSAENNHAPSLGQPHSMGRILPPADIVVEDPHWASVPPKSHGLSLEPKNQFHLISIFSSQSDPCIPRDPNMASWSFESHDGNCNEGVSESDQAPQADGNPPHLINQKLSCHKKEVGPIRSIEPSLSQCDNNVNTSRISKDSRKRSGPEFLKPRDEASKDVSEDFLIAGYMSSHALKERYDKFDARFDTEFKALHGCYPRIDHPDPKVQLRLFKGTKKRAVIRPQNSSRDQPHERPVLLARYGHLIRLMYALHEEYLNSCEIPTFMYSTWQEKLLDWVDYEISGSDSESCPILGLNRSSKLEWANDYEYRDTQVKTIDYFCQDSKKIIALPTATYLLESFKTKNPIYSFSLTGYPEELLKPSPTPNFQKNMGCLLKLVTKKDVFSKITALRCFASGKCISASKSILRFGNHIQSLRGRWKKKLQSTHPRLPITTYFGGGQSNNKILHVVEKDMFVKKLVGKFTLNRRLSRILLAMNYIQRKYHKYFQNTQDDYEKDKENMFNWLVEILISQKGQLPLFGFYESEYKLAPWEGEQNMGWKGFQTLQLQLMK